MELINLGMRLSDEIAFHRSVTETIRKYGEMLLHGEVNAKGILHTTQITNCAFCMQYKFRGKCGFCPLTLDIDEYTDNCYDFITLKSYMTRKDVAMRRNYWRFVLAYYNTNGYFPHLYVFEHALLREFRDEIVDEALLEATITSSLNDVKEVYLRSPELCNIS